MIKCVDVTKKYDGFTLNCNFEIKPGLVTGLIGRNGAGKSTTFKAILGLIHLDGGSIYYNGQLVDKNNPINHDELGCVLTDAFFNGYLLVSDVKGILKRIYVNFDEMYFDNLLIKYSIPSKKKIKDLSTGMNATLKIAAALSHHPKFLILDEPTNGLDVIARDELLDMLRQFMAEDDQHTILISSHIFSDLANICDEIIMMNHGEVSLEESLDELNDNYVSLKLSNEQYEAIDKNYIIARVLTNYGYHCISNQGSYYRENYPSVVIEKASMDDVFTVLEKGE